MSTKTEMWAVYRPDGELRYTSIRPTEEAAWESIGVPFDGYWVEKFTQKGFRCARVTVTPVEG